MSRPPAGDNFREHDYLSLSLPKIESGRRHASESVFEIVRLDRASPGEHEIGLVGHGMDMGAARMTPVLAQKWN
jgi:hypothetical protein